MRNTRSRVKSEIHRSQRSPWLRAAVLGANDGVVSVSSLMLGVAAANPSTHIVFSAGIAGLVAGALSMAVGEYVSVSSQRDSETSDLELEAYELRTNAKAELEELKQIYLGRGLDDDLAGRVATQLHIHGALEAHARDELGLSAERLSNPWLAAYSSALAFALGAAVPLLGALAFVHSRTAIALISLIALGVLGWIGAYIGGGNRLNAAARVVIGGIAAMVITTLVGTITGHVG
jgi:vacuolar iron transporter family protein